MNTIFTKINLPGFASRRCRIIFSAGALLWIAGLAGCIPVFPFPADTGADEPGGAPQPVAFWNTKDMQIVRLPSRKDCDPSHPQILIDREGSAQLFWTEDFCEEQQSEFVLRTRKPDGTWGEEERQPVDYVHAPVFLPGEAGNPCFTVSGDWNSPVLKLKCKTGEQWEESPYRGVADPFPLDIKVFIDEERIMTAYAAYRDGVEALYFGETRLTQETVDVYHLDFAKDDAGVYYLAYIVDLTSDNEYQLWIVESEDRGRTWSEHTVLSTKPTNDVKFFAGPDGEMCLMWLEYRSILAGCRTPNGWSRLVINDGDDLIFSADELRLDEGENGELQVILWGGFRVSTLHGSLQGGFSTPVILMEMPDWREGASKEYLEDLEFAVGPDGGYNMFWTAHDKRDYGKQYVYFGWLPAGG